MAATDIDTPALDAAGLARFQALSAEAVQAVTGRFYAERSSVYAQFGEPGRAACREDLHFHLEFLRPVLEFGLLQPLLDYLRWLAGVLITRDVPADHLPLSLDWLGNSSRPICRHRGAGGACRMSGSPGEAGFGAGRGSRPGPMSPHLGEGAGGRAGVRALPGAGEWPVADNNYFVECHYQTQFKRN